MWRVVCVGPGSMDKVRRVRDKGPLHPDKGWVMSIAHHLRCTGLYESVNVEGSAVKVASGILPDVPIKGQVSAGTSESAR